MTSKTPRAAPLGALATSKPTKLGYSPKPISPSNCNKASTFSMLTLTSCVCLLFAVAIKSACSSQQPPLSQPAPNDPILQHPLAKSVYELGAPRVAPQQPPQQQARTYNAAAELTENTVYLAQPLGEDAAISAKLRYNLAQELPSMQVRADDTRQQALAAEAAREAIMAISQPRVASSEDKLLSQANYVFEYPESYNSLDQALQQPSGLLPPSAAYQLQQQQQQPQHQQQQPLPANLQLITKSGLAEAAGSEQQQRPQQAKPAPSKPVLDRWSGWHDMSIDPDLAASDAASAADGRQEGPYVALLPPPESYTNKYGLPAAALRPPKWAQESSRGRQAVKSATIRPSQVDGVDLEGAHQEQQQQQQQQQSAAEHRPHPPGQFKIKGVHTATKLQPQQRQTGQNTGTKLPLNLISQNSLIKMQHPIDSAVLQQQQQQVAEQKQLAKTQQPQQLHRRTLKRRRKTNAEVRIQQLVAADQQQQQQQHDLKQVNSVLEVSKASLDQSVPAAPLQAQPERISSSRRVSQMIAPQMMAGKRPPVIVKRIGAAKGANSTRSAGARRRTLRRRRVKTLLPVGLTSWFLGGIRDLDGRHWQLPGELMSKLAINDVDFNPHQPKMSKPAAGSVILFPSDKAPAGLSREPATSSRPEPAAPSRAPISVSIPK